jgi:hypothetical protein
MQPQELLALRVQWRRISNDARSEFKVLTDRNAEQPGSFATTPVQASKVIDAARCVGHDSLILFAQCTPVRLTRSDIPLLQLPCKVLIRAKHNMSRGPSHLPFQPIAPRRRSKSPPSPSQPIPPPPSLAADSPSAHAASFRSIQQDGQLPEEHDDRTAVALSDESTKQQVAALLHCPFMLTIYDIYSVHASAAVPVCGLLRSRMALRRLHVSISTFSCACCSRRIAALILQLFAPCAPCTAAWPPVCKTPMHLLAWSRPGTRSPLLRVFFLPAGPL